MENYLLPVKFIKYEHPVPNLHGGRNAAPLIDEAYVVTIAAPISVSENRKGNGLWIQTARNKYALECHGITIDQYEAANIEALRENKEQVDLTLLQLQNFDLRTQLSGKVAKSSLTVRRLAELTAA
jgi:hypothetical protein